MGAGFLTVALLVLRKDLAIEAKSREIAYTTLFFAVSCVLFFAFALVLLGFKLLLLAFKLCLQLSLGRCEFQSWRFQCHHHDHPILRFETGQHFAHSLHDLSQFLDHRK